MLKKYFVLKSKYPGNESWDDEIIYTVDTPRSEAEKDLASYKENCPDASYKLVVKYKEVENPTILMLQQTCVNDEHLIVDVPILIDYGHTLEEYAQVYGPNYDEGTLWDFGVVSIEDGTMIETLCNDYDGNSVAVFWALKVNDEIRYYETGETYSLEEALGKIDWTAVGLVKLPANRRGKATTTKGYSYHNEVNFGSRQVSTRTIGSVIGDEIMCSLIEPKELSRIVRAQFKWASNKRLEEIELDIDGLKAKKYQERIFSSSLSKHMFSSVGKEVK